MILWSRGTALLLLLAALLVHPAAGAYESDVHFGLTRWLALKAGFDPHQADAIAMGNQRVDAGLMDTLALSLEYACTGKFPEVAQQVQARHFPAVKPVPVKAEYRPVEPGSEPARAALRTLQSMRAGKEGLLLSKFGEALHPLQDSWSHRGVPGAPAMIGSLPCATDLLSMHPAAPGAAPHDADLTHRAMADAVAMARASYEALLDWPPIAGKQRMPANWDALQAPLSGFFKGSTKTAKRQWFLAQGFDDTSFLEGVSLPDGPYPGALRWTGRRLPPLQVGVSNQHEADAQARAFFDRLLARWLGDEKVEAVLADMGPAKASLELAARLKAWKVQDHGAVATIAHAKAPLGSSQLRRLERLTRDGKAFVRRDTVADAVFPLQALAPYATPLLPYVTSVLPVTADGASRIAAILRLRHAPYDTLALVAEKQREGWILVELVAVADH